jgi:endonuclease/exonuclease/phosphatase family metal-dependent hydrolase
MGKIRKILVGTFIILFLGLFLVPTVRADHYNSKFSDEVKVMTWNLYIGADISPFFAAGSLDEIPQLVAEKFAVLQSTNFPERAKAIAKEIARKKPDLIGLQEVTLIRRQSPGDFFTDPSVQPNAEFPILDYLDILLQALTALGLEYDVAVSQDNADIELPMLNIAGGIDDVRVTDRDVILARHHHVQVSYPEGRTFSEILQIGFPPSAPVYTLPIKRGFVAVDAEVRGRTYRFVNTHLEQRGEELGSSQLSAIQAAQALELIIYLENETLPIILVGDFNSSPKDPTLSLGGLQIIPPYGMLRWSGYVDAWKVRQNRSKSRGYTCCQDEDLLSRRSHLSERIDHIFIRNDVGSWPFTRIGPTNVYTVGDSRFDKTHTHPALWPSDHAGVYGAIEFPSWERKRWLSSHKHHK